MYRNNNFLSSGILDIFCLLKIKCKCKLSFHVPVKQMNEGYIFPVKKINYWLILLLSPTPPINIEKRYLNLYKRGFQSLFILHFHSTRLCCPDVVIVMVQLTETCWLLPEFWACFLCNNPLQFLKTYLDLWCLFSINSHCFFFKSQFYPLTSSNSCSQLLAVGRTFTEC